MAVSAGRTRSIPGGGRGGWQGTSCGSLGSEPLGKSAGLEPPERWYPVLPRTARRFVPEAQELPTSCSGDLFFSRVYFTKLRVFFLLKAEPEEAATGDTAEQRSVLC